MRRPALRAMLAPLAVLLFAAQLAVPARGALFDDDEARRRIDELKTRVDQLERTLAQRLDALEAKNAGLADLFRDVEQLKGDVAKLRGQYEVLTYELEQAQKRQRDLYLDLDSRLRRLEGGPGAPGTPGAPGAPPTSGDGTAPPAAAAPPPAVAPGAADPAAEQKSYDAALDSFKSGNFGAAVASFQSFVRAYPRSPLAPSAMYWAGNA
ncbi:MAG: YbgF trimerization domain-containing protein, partial [Burkholderiales bacterium]